MATKITKKITVDLLTPTSVSIVTEKFATVGGVEQQIGNRERKAYSNSKIGRQSLIDEVGEPYCSSVFIVWGDTPTVEDPPVPN